RASAVTEPRPGRPLPPRDRSRGPPFLMILFRHRIPSLLLLALGLLAGPAGAADDTNSSGTFTTPSYPTPPAPRSGTTGLPPGTVPGAGTSPGAPNAFP